MRFRTLVFPVLALLVACSAASNTAGPADASDDDSSEGDASASNDTGVLADGSADGASKRDAAATDAMALPPGTLDLSYGSSGVTRGSLEALRGRPTFAFGAAGEAFVLEPVQALAGVVRVTKLDAKGQVDTTYGTAGHVDLQPTGNPYASVAGNGIVQSDGKLIVPITLSNSSNRLVPGNTSVLARLDVSGALDTTFGTNGYVTYAACGSLSADIVQPGGNIVAMANCALAPSGNHHLVRFTSAGAIDTTFGTNGKVDLGASYFFGLAPATGTELFVYYASSNCELSKFAADGAKDLAFQYKTTTAYNCGIAAQATGTYATGQGPYSPYVVARLDDAGAPDLAFGDAGTVSYDSVRLFTVVADGPSNVLVSGCQLAGLAETPLVLRVTPTGKSDPSFGTAGSTVISSVTGGRAMALGVSATGILAGIMVTDSADGSFSWAVARLAP